MYAEYPKTATSQVKQTTDILSSSSQVLFLKWRVKASVIGTRGNALNLGSHEEEDCHGYGRQAPSERKYKTVNCRLLPYLCSLTWWYNVLFWRIGSGRTLDWRISLFLSLSNGHHNCCYTLKTVGGRLHKYDKYNGVH